MQSFVPTTTLRLTRSSATCTSPARVLTAPLLMLTMAVAATLAPTASLASSSAAAAAPIVGGAKATCPALLNHRFESLQGEPRDMCAYAGKVVLVVNTASYCGFTKQYEGLQTVFDRFKDRGLVVVGFPANDFGKQEPGSNAEVADFCERTYRVRFPMMAKTSVVQGTANPLHEALAQATGERPKWNFHKYLIDRSGKAAGSYGSRVEPTAAELVNAIEKLLAQPAPASAAVSGK
jgi:glutathione peroxidase